MLLRPHDTGTVYSSTVARNSRYRKHEYECLSYYTALFLRLSGVCFLTSSYSGFIVICCLLSREGSRIASASASTLVAYYFVWNSYSKAAWRMASGSGLCYGVTSDHTRICMQVEVPPRRYFLRLRHSSLFPSLPLPLLPSFPPSCLFG